MKQDFASKTVESLFDSFSSSDQGLSAQKIKERQKDGQNVFESKKILY